jgi:orotidine-5'-phosphate decarboxylase
MEAKKRIIVSLDVPNLSEALSLVTELRNEVAYFKVGLELLSSVGPAVVEKIRALGGQVFYDGKFFDIPNTVAGASRSVTRLGVAMFNVHTLGGLEMMKAARKAAIETSHQLSIPAPLVLGVTLLTSLDEITINQELALPGRIEERVVHLARLASMAELDGVIASPQEVAAIRRSLLKEMVIVVPGVRPTWAEAFDQKRVATPKEAIAQGATYLVIGRPITHPPAEIGSPKEAVKLISDEIAQAI